MYYESLEFKVFCLNIYAQYLYDEIISSIKKHFCFIIYFFVMFRFCFVDIVVLK